MTWKQFSILALLGITLITTGGCALLLIGGAAAAGAGTAIYLMGELKATEAVSFERAWNACEAGLVDLDFSITSREKDALSGVIIARGAGDRKITIKLTRLSDRVTEIRIRVDTFGDESLSRFILDKIKSHF
ncbi:MAG: DUF3568 domain-containing protein [Candidatus Sumerlaeia bacterium]|nr:DUF3568 domain-containing protein [Candidatus Sumerlaeia bacterium]